MASSGRPNVILFIVHDLGTMLGCYGADPMLRTPCLDKLASEGVCFENHYATAPFCSPSRGGILTGMVPHVNGLMGLVNLGWDMPAGTRTAGHLFRDAGYRTLLFGLQHEAKDPGRLGFDHVSERSGGFASGVVAPAAVKWLDSRGNNDTPFYMQIGFSDVHRPFPDRDFEEDELSGIAPLPYLNDTRGQREDLWDFYGLIETMDRNVRVVLEALDRSSERDNTIVVFTTDHGIAFPRAKATLYDAGINTALLIRWPDRVIEGTRDCSLLSNIDLLPTLLEAVGSEPPASIQGRSFLGLLTGEDYATRQSVFAELNTPYWNSSRCIRTDRYKYIKNYDPGPLTRLPSDIEIGKTRRDMGDPPLWTIEPEELYDISLDPTETNNLVDDPSSVAALEELRNMLMNFQQETNDPILNGPVPRPPDEKAIIDGIYAKRIGKR